MIVMTRTIIHVPRFRSVIIQEHGIILINPSCTFKKPRDRSPNMWKRRYIGSPKAPVDEIATPTDSKRVMFCKGFSSGVFEIFQNTLFILRPVNRFYQFSVGKKKEHWPLKDSVALGDLEV